MREVARLEVIDHDYAYKLMVQTARKHGLEYKPHKMSGSTETPGLTNESKTVRARLGDELYKLELSPGEAALSTGVPLKAQKLARDRPFNHDWTLSQIERLARARGMTFRELLLKACLAPDLYRELQKAQNPCTTTSNSISL